MDYKKLKANAFETYMNSHDRINLRKYLIDDLECLVSDPFIPVRRMKRYDARKATDFFIKRAGFLDNDD